MLEEIERFDSPQPEDNGIEKSENFFGRTVAIVPLGEGEMTVQKVTEIELLKIFLQKRQAAKVGQTPPGKFDF